MTTFLKTESKIRAWLDRHKVNNYELVPDEKYGYVVNVNEDVDLYAMQLTHIPVKFDQVIRHFYCNNNQLTSLEFCPTYVGGDFNCDNNELTSLEFCPAHVDGFFYCDNNELTSLKFCPAHIGGDFSCNDNQLTTLEFCPTHVDGFFYCDHNQLISLEFCPTHVGAEFYCDNNPLMKDIRDINDFNVIYQEHLKTKIMLAKDQLDNILNKQTSPQIVSSQEKSKMKI